jgi:hypothetical protein
MQAKKAGSKPGTKKRARITNKQLFSLLRQSSGAEPVHDFEALYVGWNEMPLDRKFEIIARQATIEIMRAIRAEISEQLIRHGITSGALAASQKK